MKLIQNKFRLMSFIFALLCVIFSFPLFFVTQTKTPGIDRYSVNYFNDYKIDIKGNKPYYFHLGEQACKFVFNNGVRFLNNDIHPRFGNLYIPDDFCVYTHNDNKLVVYFEAFDQHPFSNMFHSVEYTVQPDKYYFPLFYLYYKNNLWYIKTFYDSLSWHDFNFPKLKYHKRRR